MLHITKLFAPEKAPVVPNGKPAPPIANDLFRVDAPKPFWAKPVVTAAKAAGTTAAPLTKIVSLMDGGRPLPTLSDVAFTRTLVMTKVSTSPVA